MNASGLHPRSTDHHLIVEAFDRAAWPGGSPSLKSAWLAIIQVLLWYEQGFLHIRESSDLRSNQTWQQRASRAEQFIARQLGVPAADLPGLLDRMMNLPPWKGRQRQNPLGLGFRTLVAQVLARWGSQRHQYVPGADATAYGIRMPGRSSNRRIDVLAASSGRPTAAISCKWSIRSDRLSDPRYAAMQQQIPGLSYVVITAELDGGQLERILDQPAVTTLVHLHLGLLELVWGESSPAIKRARTQHKLLDLTEFSDSTRAWSAP